MLPPRAFSKPRQRRSRSFRKARKAGTPSRAAFRAISRPPQSYSPVTATAIALRDSALWSSQPEGGNRRARGAGPKLAGGPQSARDRRHAYRLLVAYWAGTDRSALQKIAAQLKSNQQADGGSSSLDGRPRDAYSTGEALYALTNRWAWHLRIPRGSAASTTCSGRRPRTDHGTWRRDCILPRR